MVTKEQVTSIAHSICNVDTNKPYKVYQQFMDYFGEDAVDFQSGSYSFYGVIDSIVARYAKQDISEEDLTQAVKDMLNTKGFMGESKRILVRWPQVTVKNERDNEVLLKEFYAEVPVEGNGKLSGYFRLNRADYPVTHFYYGYMHSHVRSIPTSGFTVFQDCCLGSGPIRDTISTLNRTCDFDKWALFCLELDRYVHVESLNGGPYHRMSELRPLGNSSTFTVQYKGCVSTFSEFSWYRVSTPNGNRLISFFTEATPEFVKFLLKSNVLQFKFTNGAYAIAKPELDTLLAVSDAFIDWFNLYYKAKGGIDYQGMLDSELLYRVSLANGVLTCRRDARSDAARYLAQYQQSYEGKRVCTFKGNPVTVHIHPDTDEEQNVSEVNLITVLNPAYVATILTNIVKFVNEKNIVNND